MSRAMSATRARDGTIARAVTASRASETATRRRSTRRRRARSTRPTTTRGVSEEDAERVIRCCELARECEGKSAPHPLSACAVAERASGRVVAEASHEGQGATRAEISCANDLAARGVCLEASGGGTVYVNLEPVHGEVAGETRERGGGGRRGGDARGGGHVAPVAGFERTRGASDARTWD